MTPTTFQSDKKIIAYLQTICRFHHEMEDDRCIGISFHDNAEILGNTIRRNHQKIDIINTVAKLKHLKFLNVRKAKLGMLPPMASSSLEFIDASCNDLNYFPNWILQQSSLRFLNLGANFLTELPDLSELPLKTLKLHKNRLSKLPRLGTQIKTLNLFLNRFQDVPEVVYNLPLEVFAFGASEARSLNATALTKLRWLTMTINKIEVVEGLCDRLEGLILAKNKISQIPDLGPNLKFLSLYSNDLTTLPASFFTLKLKKLNLNKNPLLPEIKQKLKTVFANIDFFKV